MMPHHIAVSLEGFSILVFKRRKVRLREVNNLSQAAQLNRDWQNWHQNSDLCGFRSQALSVTLCAFPQRGGGAAVLAPSLRREILGKSFTRLPSISSASKAVRTWSLAGWL